MGPYGNNLGEKGASVKAFSMGRGANYDMMYLDLGPAESSSAEGSGVMFKNILVFLDGGPDMDLNLKASLAVARVGAGRVRGLVVKRLGLSEIAVMPPGPELGTGTPMIFDPDVLAAFDKEQGEVAQRAGAAFSLVPTEVSAGLEVIQGDVIEEMSRATHGADLVVMGRGWQARETRELWVSEVTRRLLKQSWAPVLLPGGPVEAMLSGPYLLGYDGSPAANRALRQVARLAALTGAALTVVAVGEPDVTEERLGEVRSYLRVYQPGAQLHARKGKPTAVLTELSREQGFSLIALGAHGHSRIKDILLGTTTEELLRTIPQAFMICAL